MHFKRPGRHCRITRVLLAVAVLLATPPAGFGLMISQEFLKKLGGTMRIESELGKGTTFILSLS